MKAFTKNRLDAARNGTGHWKNVSPEIKASAIRLHNELNMPGANITGYVINVDYAVSKLPRVRYYEWLNGVGNLVSPKP
jgi:hypothetical protein